MNVDTDQKYPEKVEAAANIICQLKQRDNLNKGHDKMSIQDVEEVSHVYRFPMLEYMSFDTDISDRVENNMAHIILGEIIRLHQRTKTPLKYVHTN